MEGRGTHSQTLADLLPKAAEVDVHITGVKMGGQGGSASIDIALDNAEVLKFEPVRKMIQPQYVLAEVLAQT